MAGIYSAFGLNIYSPFDLPEAVPADSGTQPDVTARFGKVDISLLEHPSTRYYGEEKQWWECSPSENVLLFRSMAGAFEVRNGTEIIIEPDGDVSPALLRTFLLGSSMGAIQVQRGRVPIHGGAVVSNNRAIIITGWQGAGKSTMTSTLVHNGFKYLTDDVSSVVIDEDGVWVLPAYPQRKLVRDACVQLGYDPQTLVMVDEDRDKFAIRDRERWQPERVRAGMLIELYPAAEGEGLEASEVTGHDQLGLIMRSLYRQWMHVRNGNVLPAEFKKILTIATSMKMYRVIVPRGLESISEIAEELAASLGMSLDD